MRTRSRQSLRGCVAVLLCATMLLSSAISASGAPTNAAIRAKQAQADAAERKLQQLGAELEMRGEELAQIEADVQRTRDEIEATQADLDKANQDLAASQAQLDTRASSIYRSGAVGVVSVLVGANSFLDLINRIDLMRRIGDSDAAMVASVKDAKDRVVAAKSALETKEAEQLALREEARAKNDQVSQAQANQAHYVATLKTDLKSLIDKERKRQEAIAARKRAEAEARARAIALRNKTTLPFTGQLGSPHREVVAIAEKYLGVPYVWGGTSPAGFDCSGLVQFCYQQVGIQLPRTSRLQFHAGSYIPPDRTDLLKPGDLVFFGYNADPNQIHHVALYIGGGYMIEAPYTGAHVWRSSLIARINSENDYVGGCRP